MRKHAETPLATDVQTSFRREENRFKEPIKLTGL